MKAKGRKRRKTRRNQNRLVRGNEGKNRKIDRD